MTIVKAHDEKLLDHTFNIKSTLDLYAPGGYASIGQVEGVIPKTVNSCNSGISQRDAPEDIWRRGIGVYRGLHSASKVYDKWNLEGAAYTTLSADISAQGIRPTGMFFKPDGLVLYVSEEVWDRIYQYDLAVAWDISTLTYSGKFHSVTAQEVLINDIFFKPDGTRCYITGSNSDRVRQYNLTTAWDIDTAAYAGRSFNFNAQDTSPEGIFFKPDGLTLFMVGDGNNRIYQYELSTAWNLDTVTFTNKMITISVYNTKPRGISFANDGRTFHVVGYSPKEVFQFKCTTPWDLVNVLALTSIRFDLSNEFDNTGGEGPEGLCFRPDGLAFYAIGMYSGTTATIYQYTTETIPLPIPFTPEILSNDSDDTVIGSGARALLIQGLDADFNPQSEVLPMQGTTPVSSLLEWSRVVYSQVATAGVLNRADGIITVRSTIDPSVIYVLNADSENTGTVLTFTVPAGKSVLLVDYGINHCTVSNTAPVDRGFARVQLLHLGFEESFFRPVSTVFSSCNGRPVKESLTGILIREKTSIIVRVQRVSVNSQVGGYINYCEIDNDLINMDNARYFPQL